MDILMDISADATDFLSGGMNNSDFLLHRGRSESFQWFIEDQALYNLAPTIPASLPLASRAKSYDGEKAWSSINQSIFCGRNKCTDELNVYEGVLFSYMFLLQTIFVFYEIERKVNPR